MRITFKRKKNHEFIKALEDAVEIFKLKGEGVIIVRKYDITDHRISFEYDIQAFAPNQAQCTARLEYLIGADHMVKTKTINGTLFEESWYTGENLISIAETAKYDCATMLVSNIF